MMMGHIPYHLFTWKYNELAKEFLQAKYWQQMILMVTATQSNLNISNLIGNLLVNGIES